MDDFGEGDKDIETVDSFTAEPEADSIAVDEDQEVNRPKKS